jgi:hypothetical protein
MKYFMLLSAFLGITVTAMAHGMSETDQAAALAAGPLEFIRLGAIHMLTGYDHLLFLFGVMVFLSGFKDIVKFISENGKTSQCLLFVVHNSAPLIRA